MKKAILALLTTVALCGACTRSITFPGADEGAVRITAITDDIIHVEAVPAGASFSRTPSLAVIRNHRPYLRFRHREEADAFVLETGDLRLRVAKSDGSVIYYLLEDDSLIAAEEARSFSPVTVEGRQAWTVRQTFLPQDEGFYGLGQHQADEWDYKGSNEELIKDPKVVALIHKEVVKVNEGLAPHEQIKREQLAADDWSVANGLLSQTLKLKRKALNAKYASQIEAIYENS